VNARRSAIVWILLGSSAAAARAAEPVSVCVPSELATLADGLAPGPRRVELIAFCDARELLAKAGACEAIVGLYPGPDLAAVVGAAKKLRWLQAASAGVEEYLAVAALRERPIVLTNTRIVQGPEVADHAFALLLALTRDLRALGVAGGAARLPLVELDGKTALVVGLGGIGTQVAQRAAAFGMRVLAVDPKDLAHGRDVAFLGKPDELDALLPEADVVSLCAPLTAATRRMIDRERFERAKRGVYLVNVARGGLVDTAALLEALRSGRVRAAGLDVTDPEPLPADHPLLALPNVLVTPHVAWASDRVDERRRALDRANLARFLAGQPLANVVNQQAGY
jgi:phosphoglycerate dehydrogenase-like enzyme